MEIDPGAEKPDELPAYTESLAMFHEEFRPELAALLRELPLKPAASCLDVGCGDGFYTALWADLRPQITAVGIDANRAMVERARETYRAQRNVSFEEASLDALERFHGRFDLVWCAQSLFSFVDETKAIQSMLACVRPGGILAILENDYLHQLLLPWPADVELDVRGAELAALRAETEKSSRFYVGRRLPQLLAQNGLQQVRFRTQAIDRAAPMSEPLRKFVDDYLAQLHEKSAPHLDPAVAARVGSLLASSSPAYLAKQPLFTMTWLNNFACGTRPDPS